MTEEPCGYVSLLAVDGRRSGVATDSWPPPKLGALAATGSSVSTCCRQPRRRLHKRGGFESERYVVKPQPLRANGADGLRLNIGDARLQMEGPAGIAPLAGSFGSRVGGAPASAMNMAVRSQVSRRIDHPRFERGRPHCQPREVMGVEAGDLSWSDFRPGMPERRGDKRRMGEIDGGDPTGPSPDRRTTPCRPTS